jgi:hypothetical protein
LLKQDADKGRPIDPWNIQTIPNIPLVVVDSGEILSLTGIYGSQVKSLNTGKKLQRTKFKLPKMIDLNYGTSLMIYNPVGEEVQLVSKSRMSTVRNKR